jgi:TPR repeat protein
LIFLVLNTSPSSNAQGGVTNAAPPSGQASITNSKPEAEIWTVPAEDLAAAPLLPKSMNRASFGGIKAKAEKGDVEAQFTLAVCYYDGLGVTANEAEAVKWCLKAAEQNHAEAQYRLALYYNGWTEARDATQAAKWCRKAAEQNLAEAQYRLGIFYFKGEGVVKDGVVANE